MIKNTAKNEKTLNAEAHKTQINIFFININILQQLIKSK